VASSTPHEPFAGPGSSTPVVRTRASGLGIAGLVLGLLGLLIAWVPFCGSIPGGFLALIGLVLGIVGWATARSRNDTGTGFPIAAVCVSLLALLVGVGSMFFGGTVIQGFARATARDKAALEERRRSLEMAPAEFRNGRVFFVSGGGTLAGSGFLIRTGSTTYAVTARHPYDGEKPDAFLDIEADSEITLGRRVHAGSDTQVMEVPAEAVRNWPVFSYGGAIPLRDGDRVAIVWDNGIVEGKLTSRPLGSGYASGTTGQISLDKPFPAAGTSGSPVILISTGTVVGVLLSADDPENATTIGFEELHFDSPEPTTRPE
jgi:hypothetical protein